MPDLLTHALVAYSIATALSVRYDWITPQLATVAMAGGVLPDLSKVRLVAPATTVETVLGVPFAWHPFHTIGGTGIIVLAATLLVRPEYRRPVAISLGVGVLSHFVLDAFLAPPAGTFAYFWPLIGARIALPGFYRSGDPWILPVAVLLALGVRSAVRRRSLEAASPTNTDR